jgi:hypothetical protein
VTGPVSVLAEPGPGRTTTPAGPGRAPAPTTGTGTGPPRAHWRRWRGLLAVVLLILLGGTLVALLTPAPSTDGYLDPGSTGPQGTRALAALLSQRGQTVIRTGSVAAAQAAARGGRASLVITSPYLLSPHQLAQLVRMPGDLMVVEPDSLALAALGPGTAVTGAAAARPADPGCGLAAATAAGNATMGGVLLRASQPGAWQCYRVNGQPSLVRYPARGRSVTLLGSGAPLTNSALGARGNAALALNLLTGDPRIIWLVPGQPAAPAATGGPKSLLQEIPGPAYLVTLQLFIAAGLAALWRMRRLGPLVTEPLPVVVRASETVEGHSRLYQSRRARDRAAAVLRTAARQRITSRLALPSDAGPEAVCAAVAARTGRDLSKVRAILFGPAPRDDAALVALGRDIDALEGEVRTP